MIANFDYAITSNAASDSLYALIDGVIVAQIEIIAHYSADGIERDGLDPETPAWFEGPYVKDDMRRKGIGKELIRRMENQFNAVSSWDTSLMEREVESQLFLKACGYTCYESSKEPVTDGECLYLFRKECRFKPF